MKFANEKFRAVECNAAFALIQLTNRDRNRNRFINNDESSLRENIPFVLCASRSEPALREKDLTQSLAVAV